MTCPKEELFGEINKKLEIPLALSGCKWYNLSRAFCQGTFSVSIYAQKQAGLSDWSTLRVFRMSKKHGHDFGKEDLP